LPLDLFAVRDGKLAYVDLARKHGMGETGPLKVSWSRFDNNNETKTPLPQETSFSLPREAFDPSDTAYYAADISKDGDTKRSVTVYVRTRRGQAEVVGIDRSW
jgi:hypothetical protein